MKFLPSLFVLLVVSQITAYSQDNLVIDTSTYSVDQLVREVLFSSECANISNVQFMGESGQIGYFENGSEAMGFESGIIISTGRVHHAIGPNDSTGTSTAYRDPGLGDDDLRRVANLGLNQVHDDAILSFDFIPITDHIEFEFVFASEEYCDFVDSIQNRNDVFAFFLEGPGLFGPYSNNAINIASLPGGNQNITVLNINHDVNFDYFIDNTPVNQLQRSGTAYANCDLHPPRGGVNSLLDQDGMSIDILEYDGYTTVLKAERTVTPFQSYHLRIAIGDIGDDVWDSAVFLKSGSFQAGQPTAVISSPDSLTCAQTTLVLDGDLSTQGVDFSLNWTTLDGNIVSDSQSSMPTINQPGMYQLVVTRIGSACTDTARVHVIFHDDIPDILGATSGTILCDQTEVDIEILIAPVNSYTYQVRFPTGALSPIQNSPSFLTAHAGWHDLMAISTTGCVDIHPHFVNIDSFAGIATIQPLSMDCRVNELFIDIGFIDGGYSFQFAWQSTGGFLLSPNDSVIARIGTPGFYQLVAINDSNGCTGTFDLTVTDLRQFSVIDAGPDLELTCSQVDAIAQGEISYEIGNETVMWSSINGAAHLPGVDKLHPILNQPDAYILHVENENGCVTTDTMSVSQLDDAPVISIVQVDTLDCDETFGIVEVDVAEAFSSINWSTTDGFIEIISATSLAINVSQIGRYTIEVFDSNNCSSTLSIDVMQNDGPLAEILGNAILDCDDETLLTANPNGAGATIDYSWRLIGSPQILSTIDELLVQSIGIFELTVSDLRTGCSSVDSITTMSSINEVESQISFINCSPTQGEFSIVEVDRDLVDQFVYQTIPYGSDETILVMTNERVEILLSNGCSQIVSIDPQLMIDLEVGLTAPDEIILGQLTLIQGTINRESSEIASISWSGEVDIPCDTCLIQELAFTEPTRLELIITDIYGCSEVAFILINPISIVDIYIPTAFSPNNDGINDKMEIFMNNQGDHIRSISIFDRWGNQVFARANNSLGDIANTLFAWNGTNAGGKPAPSAVYMYAAEIVGKDKQSRFRKGEFILVR